MHDVAIHDESKTQYLWVWGGLLVLTAIEVFLAYEQLFTPIKMLLILLGLSVIKAALIILYFMHLKFETRRMRYVLMVAGVVCLSLMSMFFADAVRILRLGVKIS
jgi:cytochrome c oxidase subunit 4